MLLRNEKIGLETWLEISQDLSLRRWLACQTLPKAWDLSSATAGVATDLLIVKTILVGATAKISENERTLNDMQNGKRKVYGR